MNLQIRPLVQDEYGRMFGAADPDTARALFQHNHQFWTSRFNAELSEQQKANIIESQWAKDSPFNTPMTEKLCEIIREADAHSRFSMLEIGAANGNAVKRIKQRMPDLDFDYVGFECFELLCEDFAKTFPEHTIFVGDIDTMIETDLSEVHDGKFTLFYACGTFIMVHPDVVLRGLKRAAKCADQFLIYEIISPPEFELKESEIPVVVSSNRSVVWYIHPWEEMLEKVGFKIVDRFAASPALDDPALRETDNQYRGYGYIHAVRA